MFFAGGGVTGAVGPAGAGDGSAVTVPGTTWRPVRFEVGGAAAGSAAAAGAGGCGVSACGDGAAGAAGLAATGAAGAAAAGTAGVSAGAAGEVASPGIELIEPTVLSGITSAAADFVFARAARAPAAFDPAGANDSGAEKVGEETRGVLATGRPGDA